MYCLLKTVGITNAVGRRIMLVRPTFARKLRVSAVYFLDLPKEIRCLMVQFGEKKSPFGKPQW